MSQHDYDLANANGASFRSDINSALAAIVGLNNGASAPATTFAHMLWVDTTNNKLKMRNAANNAWIEVGNIGSANLGLLLATAAVAATIDGVSNAGGDIDLVAGTGLTITPSDASNNITFALSGGAPKAAAYRSTTQSINSGTWTQVQQNAEEFDVGGYMEISGSFRFFPAVAGKYLLCAQVAFQAAASGNCSMYAAIYKNGSAHRANNAGYAAANYNRTVPITSIVDANGSSDYFQLYTYHDQGGAMTVDAGADRTFFHATFLG